MTAQTKEDEELTLLLTKLYSIQETVGAKEKSSDEEKKARAEQAGQQVSMGKGKKAKKTGSRFLELKSSIVDRLKTVHGLIEEQSNSKRSNPKEAIAAQAEIREQIRQASDEWGELNALYKKEARKKKSKFTPDELEVQQALVMQLNAEIEKVKDAQLQGFGRGGSTEATAALNLGALAALDAADIYAANDGELIAIILSHEKNRLSGCGCRCRCLCLCFFFSFLGFCNISDSKFRSSRRVQNMAVWHQWHRHLR